MRLVIRAKPGSRSESVTVATDHSGAQVLIVRVRARAVDGAANEAVVAAVAKALGVRKRDVSMVVGQRSRDKHLEVDAEPEDVRAALAELTAEDLTPPA
ncbi:MAG: DUF167 domain-containing protein [Candidatus Nanopelagicales bacterium]